MKYTYLYIALIILILVIGCSKAPADTGDSDADDTISGSQTQADSQPADDTTDTAPAGTADAAPDDSYALSSEEEAKAKNFESGRKTMISTPYKIMQVGDVYVFGVGIKNILPGEYNFRIQLHFSEAKTTGGLATLMEGTDEDTMLGWMGKNRFSQIKIAPNEETVVPLIVYVGSDIGPGESTGPGSYDFDIGVEYESNPHFWEEYETNVLTIKVKE
ncbi:hypothetical protein ACFL96_10300 [Thermoproteota archaeon]